MNATAGQWQPPSGAACSKAKRRRNISRAAALLAAAALLSPWLAGTQWPQLVPAASAWVAVCSAAALRGAESVFLAAGLSAAVVALFWQRWFCRWGCPVGLCADGASRIGRAIGCRSLWMPPLGQWAAVMTLAGAAVGYPLLLFADPLAMMAGFSGLWAPPVPTGAIYAALGLPAVCFFSVLLPGLWCARICPLGATQDILWRVCGWLKLLSASAICCVRTGLRTIRPGIRPATGAAEAPDGASSRWAHRAAGRQGAAGGQAAAGDEPAALDGWPLARRTAIAALLGAVGASFARREAAGATRKIRPPSARPEADFLGLCIRCGNCARACPSKIIAPDVSPSVLTGLLAPVVSFSADYCREDCQRCTEVCPTGAIAPLPNGDKLAAPMGVVRVDMSLCLLGDDRECFVCRNACPFQAIALIFSEDTYSLTPRIDPPRCPGCGACQAACPVTPKKAIVVHPLR